MRVVPGLCCAVALVRLLPHVRAQSAADAATLQDLKLAARQMDLQSEGAVPFHLEATFETSDYLGVPDNQGRWTEDFAKPGYLVRTVRDKNSPGPAAASADADAGTAPMPIQGAYLSRVLMDALLMPGPSDAMLEHSKATYKQLKVGATVLRCVTLESLEKAQDANQQAMASRAYCLAADKPIIRLTQLQYGMWLRTTAWHGSAPALSRSS